MAFDQDRYELIFVVFAFAVATFLLGLGIGQAMGELDHEKESVKQGHAQWAHDENGRATFEWLPASDHTKPNRRIEDGN